MPLAGVSRDYLLFEARRAPRAAALAAAACGVLVVLGSHAVIVRLPSPALRYMELAFRLDGIASLLLVNDLLAVYFVAFFVGLGSVLDTTVGAREEGRLELLLAKPLPGRVLVAARVAPILATAASAGAVVAIAMAIAVSRHLCAGDPITGAGTLGAGLFATAVGVALLSLLLPLLVVLRDRLQALLVTTMAWVAPLMPTGFFIYRPDLFATEHGGATLLLLPSLLWHDATIAWLGPVALAASVVFGGLMVLLAGLLLERSDAR